MTLTIDLTLDQDPTVSRADGWEFFVASDNAIAGTASGGAVLVNIDLPDQSGYWVLLSTTFLAVTTGAAFAAISTPSSWDRIGAEWILGGPIETLASATREPLLARDDPNQYLPRYLGRPASTANVFTVGWDVNVNGGVYQVAVNLCRRLAKPKDIPWEWM